MQENTACAKLSDQHQRVNLQANCGITQLLDASALATSEQNQRSEIILTNAHSGQVHVTHTTRNILDCALPKGFTRMPNNRDRAYSYLNSCTVPQLRKLARGIDVPSRARKPEMLKCFLRVLATHLDTEHANSLGNVLHGFNEWKVQLPSSYIWRVAPSIEACNVQPEVDRNMDHVSEFARLVSLLTHDQTLRDKLISSARILNRDELEGNVSRDAFWQTDVAPLFMTCSNVYKVDFSGRLDGVDSSKIPTAERSGAQLRKMFSDARAHFTLAHSRWSASGQNEPTNFEGFCSHIHGTQELSALGKRLPIMFITFRCGTTYEFTDVTCFTLRTMPGEWQQETGNTRTGGNGSPSRTSRKRSYEKMQLQLQGLQQQMRDVAVVLKQNAELSMAMKDEERRCKRLATLEIVLRLKKEAASSSPEIAAILEAEEKELLSGL